MSNQKLEQVQLVILAAGLGSRFGGLKQMAEVGLEGEWLIEFALYDAYLAGLRRLVLVVQETMVDAINEQLLSKLTPFFEVRLSIQRLSDLPESISKKVEAGTNTRVKPWGTAHALWCARKDIDADFIVMNADDYYGASCFKQLLGSPHAPLNPNVLLGFPLKCTLSAHGSVSRGMITQNDKGQLTKIVETHHLSLEVTDTSQLEALVSMNMWYLERAWVKEMEHYLVEVLSKAVLDSDKIDAVECYLPEAIGATIDKKHVAMWVVSAYDKWYGVTHKADQDSTSEALQALQNNGQYPIPIWRKVTPHHE